MSIAITRGELAEIASKLPDGDLKKWCEMSSVGPAESVVFADSDMLSRCRQSASSLYTDESESGSKPCKVSKTPKKKAGT